MVNIRRAQKKDAAKLPDVERSAGQTFLQIAELAWIATDHVQPVAWHEKIIEFGMCWTAINAENIPIGFLSAEVVEENILHVWALAVHYDAQGKGIGKALMDEAIATAKAKGLTAVTLTTFRNLAWNEQFYAKLGFKTLVCNALSARLNGILQIELAHGQSLERRCAMQLIIN